jgi:hypothetical protein
LRIHEAAFSESSPSILSTLLVSYDSSDKLESLQTAIVKMRLALPHLKLSNGPDAFFCLLLSLQAGLILSKSLVDSEPHTSTRRRVSNDSQTMRSFLIFAALFASLATAAPAPTEEECHFIGLFNTWWDAQRLSFDARDVLPEAALWPWSDCWSSSSTQDHFTSSSDWRRLIRLEANVRGLS